MILKQIHFPRGSKVFLIETQETVCLWGEPTLLFPLYYISQNRVRMEFPYDVSIFRPIRREDCSLKKAVSLYCVIFKHRERPRWGWSCPVKVNLQLRACTTFSLSSFTPLPTCPETSTTREPYSPLHTYATGLWTLTYTPLPQQSRGTDNRDVRTSAMSIDPAARVL